MKQAIIPAMIGREIVCWDCVQYDSRGNGKSYCIVSSSRYYMSIYLVLFVFAFTVTEFTTLEGFDRRISYRICFQCNQFGYFIIKSIEKVEQVSYMGGSELSCSYRCAKYTAAPEAIASERSQNWLATPTHWANEKILTLHRVERLMCTLTINPTSDTVPYN